MSEGSSHSIAGAGQVESRGGGGLGSAFRASLLQHLGCVGILQKLSRFCCGGLCVLFCLLLSLSN